MSVFANEGKNVLVNYNYMLRVEGIYDLPCKAVHSFTKENEFEYVQEGGLNDYVHMLRKPISKPFTFTVERYVGTDAFPILPLGAELILPVILMVSPHPDRFDISKRTFVFTGCTVMGKTFGELNAEKSGLLTESIVIGYREMLEVTLPVDIGNDAKKWAFDGKKVLGNKELSATRYDRGKDGEKPPQRYWRLSENADAKNAETANENTASEDAKRVNVKSAKTEKATQAEQRKWSMKGESSVRSAKTIAKTQAEQRKWSIKTDTTDSKQSATTIAASNAEQRKWPAISSAKKYTNVTEEPTE